MRLIGIALLLLVGLHGSEYTCGKKRAELTAEKAQPTVGQLGRKWLIAYSDENAM